MPGLRVNQADRLERKKTHRRKKKITLDTHRPSHGRHWIPSDPEEGEGRKHLQPIALGGDFSCGSTRQKTLVRRGGPEITNSKSTTEAGAWGSGFRSAGLRLQLLCPNRGFPCYSHRRQKRIYVVSWPFLGRLTV
jgi:hypothetical protein